MKRKKAGVELQNRTLGPATLLASLSPHGLSPLQSCALPTLAKTKRGGIAAPGDQTQKRVCFCGDVRGVQQEWTSLFLTQSRWTTANHHVLLPAVAARILSTKSEGLYRKSRALRRPSKDFCDLSLRPPERASLMYCGLIKQ